MLLDPPQVSRSEVINMKRHIASWQAIAMPSLSEAALTLAMLGALVIGLFAYKLDRLAYFLSAGGPLAGDRHFWFDNPVSQFPGRLHVWAQFADGGSLSFAAQAREGKRSLAVIIAFV